MNSIPLPPSAHFDYGNLYAQLPFKRATFSEAYSAVSPENGVPGQILQTGTASELSRLIALMGAVEHEYFHCRNTLSTPFGYALFMVRQILLNQRRRLLKLGWDHAEARAPLMRANYKALVKLVRRGRIPKQVLDEWWETHLWFMTFWALLAPDPTVIRMMRSICDAGDFGWYPFSGRQAGITARYLPQIESLTVHLAAPEPFTVPHLIEGLAIWKEYAYISQIAARTPHFRPLVDEWVSRWKSADLYRRALDALFEKTGCNASTASVGILLEIALTCPAFTPEPCAWEEFHPSARFRRILDIAPSLPRRLLDRRPDNLDRVSQEYYDEVEESVCRKLGWMRSSKNLQSSLDAQSARVEYGKSKAKGPLSDTLGRFLDRRFAQAHHHRKECVGVMLFPWNHDSAQSIGAITQPPATIFHDDLSVHLWPDEKPWMGEMFLRDLVVSLVLEGMMHSYDTNQESFRRARAVHSRIASAVGTPRLSPDGETFEELVSKDLGFDYGAYRDWLYRNR